MKPTLEALESRDAPSSLATCVPPPDAVVTDYGTRLGAEWHDAVGVAWGAWQVKGSDTWNGPGLLPSSNAPPPVIIDRLATQTLPPGAVVTQPDPSVNLLVADFLAADGTHQAWWKTSEQSWWSGPVEVPAS